MTAHSRRRSRIIGDLIVKESMLRSRLIVTMLSIHCDTHYSWDTRRTFV